MDELKADTMNTAANMNISTSSDFAASQSDNSAVLARLDAMIALMSQYFPEMSTGNSMDPAAINRYLGVASL